MTTVAVELSFQPCRAPEGLHSAWFTTSLATAHMVFVITERDTPIAAATRQPVRP